MGGKIFSIVGADGSGKSTLTQDIETWLSWKLSVRKYYYGIPKTMFIRQLSNAIPLLSKFRFNNIANLFEYLLWLYIAKKRYRIFALCKKDVLKGKTVITDRFPLKDFHSMPEPMDGPRLDRTSTRMERFWSSYEKGLYDRLEYPDCVFVLQVDFLELRRRKECQNIEALKIKAEAINNINEESSIVLVNANKPYAEVNLTIRRHIWASLT